MIGTRKSVKSQKNVFVNRYGSACPFGAPGLLR